MQRVDEDTPAQRRWDKYRRKERREGKKMPLL